MTAPLSQDLRRRIARAVADGSSVRQAAARYEVSPSAVVKLMQRVRKTGSLAPDRNGGHRRPVLELHEDLLRSLVAAKSGITLAEIHAKLKATRDRGGRPVHHPADPAPARPAAQKDTPVGRAGTSGCSAPALAGVAALHGS
jgi:transposase-like protein